MNDATYAAVDPKDIAVGDHVIVSDVGESGDVARGEVVKVTCEWGRYGHTIEREDGDAVTVWEETGRTRTRVEDAS